MILWPDFSTSLYLLRQEPDPAKKGEDYYKANMFAIYSEWVVGQTNIGYSGLNRIDMLRAFSEGRQPDKIVPAKSTQQSAILDLNGNPIKNEEEIAVPGYNVKHEVYEILSPANKIMDSLEGSLSKADYEISCDPLDYATKHEIEDKKLMAWQYGKNRTKIQFAAQLAGVEVPEPEFIPQEPSDLNNNDEYFLPDHAMYAEQVAKHSFDMAVWKPDIIKLLYRDWISCGTACVQDRYDPETGKVYPVYIDIRDAFIQRSKYPDHRDSERAGHFELINVSRLRQYFPDKDEAWIKKIAGQYCGYFGNPYPQDWNRYNLQDGYGQWGYDSFKVCMMVAEWIDIDKSKEVIGTKHGRKTIKEVPLSSKVAENKTVRFAEDRRRYEAKWIVGSDEIFDFGPAHENSPYLTYHWYTLPGKSKIEQLVPILTQFQDLWDRYRELLRNSRGKGTVIDVDKLASTSGQDDPKIAAKKAYRRFLSTYTLFIRRVNAAGMPDQTTPITETEGGMGSLFQELMLAFKTNIDLVEYITGLNPLSLGGSADPNAPVTTSQMSMNATASSLKPMVDGYMSVKRLVAENNVRWITMLIRGNEFSREAYREVIGDYGVQCLVVANKSDASYGFRMIARPNDLEKQVLVANIQAASTPAQGGEREISTADADRLYQMVASDTPVKTINHYFEKARQRQQQRLMQQKKELMQTQSQLNQQDSATAAQNQQAVADKTHQQAVELQRLKNEGLIGATTVQESMRDQKEQNVQQLKNAGAANVEMLKPRPEKVEPDKTMAG